MLASSWLALGLIITALLAFFNNWFGTQDAYIDLSGRAADQVRKSLTENLGADLLIPRPVTGGERLPQGPARVRPSDAVAQAQLTADR